MRKLPILIPLTLLATSLIPPAAADAPVARYLPRYGADFTVRQLLQHTSGPPDYDVDVFEPADAAALTDRELDVVRLVARARTNAEIGAELFVSTGTAKTHVANIQRKLGVPNRVGIATWAWERGLVS